MTTFKREIVSASRRASGSGMQAPWNPPAKQIEDEVRVHIRSSVPSSSSSSSHLVAASKKDERGLRRVAQQPDNGTGLTGVDSTSGKQHTVRPLTGTTSAGRLSSDPVGDYKTRRQSAPASSLYDKGRGRIGVECEEALSWINSTLQKSDSGKRAISDVRRAFADGVTLPSLLEVLCGAEVTGVHTRPILRMQRAENLKICLQFVTSKGVILEGIHPDDLVNGQLKSVLLLSSTLRRYEKELSPSVADSSQPEDKSADSVGSKVTGVVSSDDFSPDTGHTQLPGFLLADGEEELSKDKGKKKVPRSGREALLKPARKSSSNSAMSSDKEVQLVAADGKTSSNPGPSDITTPSKQTEITGIVPMKTVGPSSFSPIQRSSSNRSVTEAWGDDTSQVGKPTSPFQTPRSPRIHSAAGGHGTSSPSPKHHLHSPPIKTSSDDDFAGTDSGITSPSTDGGLASPSSRSPLKGGSRNRTLADGVQSRGKPHRSASVSAATDLSTTKQSQPLSPGSKSLRLQAKGLSVGSADNSAGHLSLKISDESNKKAGSPGKASSGGTSGPDSKLLSSPSTSKTSRHSTGQIPNTLAITRHMSPDEQSTQLKPHSISTSTTDSAFVGSPEKVQEVPIAMSPSAFIATPPEQLSPNASHKIVRPQPQLASPDVNFASMASMTQRLSALESMQQAWQEEKRQMQLQLQAQQHVIALLNKQEQSLQKRFQKERASVSKTMSSIEGQLVENARTSAQFSERLSRLESIPSPTSPARSADAPQATDEDLEEELIRAKLLVRRLEELTNQHTNNRLSSSSPDSPEPANSLVVVTPSSQNTYRGGRLVPTSSTPIDIAHTDNEVADSSSHDGSLSFLGGSTCGNSAVKVKKFFGAEPPHLLHQFLSGLGYEYLMKKFEKHKVGMMELPYLTEAQMRQMKVPAGPRMRILHEAQLLRQQQQQQQQHQQHQQQQVAQQH